MCDTCGCSGDAVTITDLKTGEHVHAAGAGHSHGGAVHAHPEDWHIHPGETRIVRLETGLLEKNDRLARLNRDYFAARRITAVNLVSSPGAGKTTLLERTIRDLAGEVTISVVEGDQETTRDAARIRAAGRPVVQVNTGAGCHLDADIVARALKPLAPPDDSLVFIENVGNLVCPALFDLGEAAKALVVSVTEGEDKPLKYPHMFRAARILLVNKIDLLPHLDFDVDLLESNARAVNPAIEICRISSRTGQGLAAWYDRVRRLKPQEVRI
jgi:hydrogenase nickel incorporation protein HypB